MGQPYFYETEVEWVGEKRGYLRSPTLPEIMVATPPEFMGHEHTWSPEHLFVGAVCACFVTTFLAVAELSKLEFASISAAARGKLEKLEGQGYRMTQITVQPRLVICHARDRERAARLLEKAEQHCLISNSIKTEVRLEPEIYVDEAAA
jgi:peroxiredoxin-like protein